MFQKWETLTGAFWCVFIPFCQKTYGQEKWRPDTTRPRWQLESLTSFLKELCDRRMGQKLSRQDSETRRESLGERIYYSCPWHPLWPDSHSDLNRNLSQNQDVRRPRREWESWSWLRGECRRRPLPFPERPSQRPLKPVCSSKLMKPRRNPVKIKDIMDDKIKRSERGDLISV